MRIEIKRIDEHIYIENDLYPNGVNHKGAEKLPNIVGLEHPYIKWSDFEWEDSFYIDTDGAVHQLTDIQCENLKILTSEWAQDVGQEGNPSPVQIATEEYNKRQNYLNSTDWVVVKIQELVLDGFDIEELKIKYSEILDKRKQVRAKLNELDKEFDKEIQK